MGRRFSAELRAGRAMVPGICRRSSETDSWAARLRTPSPWPSAHAHTFKEYRKLGNAAAYIFVGVIPSGAALRGRGACCGARGRARVARSLRSTQWHRVTHCVADARNRVSVNFVDADGSTAEHLPLSASAPGFPQAPGTVRRRRPRTPYPLS